MTPSRSRSNEIAQPRHERGVRRRHRIVAQVVRPHPCEGLVLLGLDQAIPASTQVQWHEQVKRIVTVAGKHERGEAGLNDVNAELLAELSDQAGLRSFPFLNLTAWKLP